MTRRGLGVLAVLALLTAAAPGIAAEDAAGPANGASQCLQMVGDAAFLVAVGRSISECEEGLRAFADNAAPGFARTFDVGRMLDDYVKDAGDGGADLSGAIAWIFLAEDETQVAAIALVPIADYDAWREAWGEAIKKDEGEIYEHLESYPGRRAYFVQREGYLAFADEAGDLDLWLKSLGTPLSDARKSLLAHALGESPFAAEVSVAALRRIYPDAVAQAESAMSKAMPFMAGQGASAVQFQAFAAMVPKFVGDVWSGIDGVTVSITPSARGIVISGQVNAVEGGIFGRIFGEQKSVDLSDMALAPADTVLMGAGGINGDTAWGYLRDIVAEMAAAGAATPEDAQAGRAAVTEAIESSRSAGIGSSVVSAMTTKATGTPFAFAVIYRVSNAEDALEIMAKTAADPKLREMNFAAAGAKPGEITISQEMIEDTPVRVITQTLDLSEADPLEQQVIENIIGGKIVTRLAAADGRLYVTSMDDGSLMREILKGGAGADRDKIRRTVEVLGGDVSQVVLLSLPGLARMIPAGRSGGPAEGDALNLNVPVTPQYAGAAVLFGKNTARFAISVPIEEILAARAVMSEAMSQSLQNMEDETDEWELPEASPDEEGELENGDEESGDEGAEFMEESEDESGGE